MGEAAAVVGVAWASTPRRERLCRPGLRQPGRARKVGPVEPIRNLEQPDPVQRHVFKRGRIRALVLWGIVLVLLLVGYFGVYR